MKNMQFNVDRNSEHNSESLDLTFSQLTHSLNEAALLKFINLQHAIRFLVISKESQKKRECYTTAQS